MYTACQLILGLFSCFLMPWLVSGSCLLFVSFMVGPITTISHYMSPREYSKHAVETTEMFDFLKEIVEAVPDPSAGGTIDLETEANADGKKKRRSKKAVATGAADGEGGVAPKRRRKQKTDAEEENDGGIAATSDKGKKGPERGLDRDAEMYDPEEDPEEEENVTSRRSPNDDDY